MLREIKFRAWAKHTVNNKVKFVIDMANKEFDPIEPTNKQTEAWDKWYDKKRDSIGSFYPLFKGDEKTIEDIMISDDLFSIGKVNSVRVNYKLLNVMQYTEIKDSNSIEIYESDIVKTTAYMNDHNQKGAIDILVVKYFMGSFCLCRKDQDSGIPIFPFNASHFIEVIGNIYENPELLEQK